MKHKLPIIMIVFLLVALFIGMGGINSIPLITSANANEQRTVIIDAGHGGFDGGAVASDGTIEKDINLKIALSVADFLKQSGFKVILTRDIDKSTDDKEGEIPFRKKNDLQNRLLLMKEHPDSIFVSVHLNKFTTSSASGAQVFYSKNRDKSLQLGQCIQESITSLLQKDNKRVIKKGNSSTYILENATIPTVIVECGFLSNSRDLSLLKQEEYQRKMAFAIYCGILNFY